MKKNESSFLISYLFQQFLPKLFSFWTQISPFLRFNHPIAVFFFCKTKKKFLHQEENCTLCYEKISQFFFVEYAPSREANEKSDDRKKTQQNQRKWHNIALIFGVLWIANEFHPMRMIVNYGNICILHMCYFNYNESCRDKDPHRPNNKAKYQYISGMQFNIWFIICAERPLVAFTNRARA